MNCQTVCKRIGVSSGRWSQRSVRFPSEASQTFGPCSSPLSRSVWQASIWPTWLPKCSHNPTLAVYYTGPSLITQHQMLTSLLQKQFQVPPFQFEHNFPLLFSTFSKQSYWFFLPVWEDTRNDNINNIQQCITDYSDWKLWIVKCQNLSPCQTQPHTQETIAIASLCIEEIEGGASIDARLGIHLL